MLEHPILLPAPEARSFPLPQAGDICIIGAGSSGVTVAKALTEANLSFDIFEKGSDIGGMWRYENDNGLSSAYASLHIDTSRENLSYSDFPIAKQLPDFLSHRDFLNYLELYADRFGIRERVSFQTAVEAVEPESGGQWWVRLSDGTTRQYRSVIVANGHLWDPRWPSFPGTFAGDQLHSHDYRTPAPFEDRDVLVVGIGNSAVDIAVDLCRRARSVTLSTRRSAWIMPKYLMGIPVDRWSRFFVKRLHFSSRLTRLIMSRLIRLGVGDQRRFGLPRPEHPMWREHATLSQELLPYIGHGWISIKPNVAHFNGHEVQFDGGHSQRFDAIIHATGYRPSFPFLSSDHFPPLTGPRHLYRRMHYASRPGLYFAGLVQPVGPTITLVEIQGRWMAAVLAGKVALPDRLAQEREIERHRERQRRTYLESARYDLEVDFPTYAKQLLSDMNSGQAGI